MTEYVTTNIRLPKETYRELKQRALDAEISLAEVVRESVAQYLVAPAAPPGIPAATGHAAAQEGARMTETRAQKSGAVMIPEDVLSSVHITAAELLLELALSWTMGRPKLSPLPSRQAWTCFCWMRSWGAQLPCVSVCDSLMYADAIELTSEHNLMLNAVVKPIA